MRTIATATTAVLLLGAIASVGPLHVVEGGVTCQGDNAVFQFSPPVSLNRMTTQISAHGALGPCVSIDDPEITGGTWNFQGVGTEACPGPFALHGGKLQISWNTGQRSMIDGVNFEAGASDFTFKSGIVVSGLFQGSAAHAQGRSSISAKELATKCATSRLTDYSGRMEAFSIGAN